MTHSDLTDPIQEDGVAVARIGQEAKRPVVLKRAEERMRALQNLQANG